MTSCSIIIRGYNEEKHIGRLLEGIQRQTVQDVETILVDSGSSDATVETAERLGAKIVHILPDEFTFGRSLNTGIAATSRGLIVIASAHVYPVYPDWLERLLEPFNDTQVALAYGKQRAPASSKFSEQQIFHQWYPEQSQPRQDHPFCNNANAAIRRSLWEQQPFDENLTGLEDLAWAKWAMSQGYVIAYAAEAEIIHFHNETLLAVFNRYRREAMAFKQLYPEAHFNLYDFVRLTTSNVLSDFWHALRYGVFWQSAAGVLGFRWMQFWGTYMGYRQSGPLTRQLRQTFYYPLGMDVSSQSKPRKVEPIRYNQ